MTLLNRKSHQCCRCVWSISPACSISTAPDACSCLNDGTASNNLLLWKQSGVFCPLLHKTALLPWSYTFCTYRQTKNKSTHTFINKHTLDTCIDARTHTHMNVRVVLASRDWCRLLSIALHFTRRHVSVCNCIVMNTLLPLSELRGQYQEATHSHSLFLLFRLRLTVFRWTGWKRFSYCK